MNLTEAVDRATTELLSHTEQVARDHGLVPPPMVWAFDPDRADPLIGWLDELQPAPSIVTLVANNRGGHQVTMHPFQFRVLGPLPSGQLSLAIDWEDDIDLRSADVPVPIAYLLGHWSTYAKRHQAAGRPDGEARQVVSEPRAQGYGIDLTHEATSSPRPA